MGRKKAKKDAEPSEDDPLTKKKSNHLQRKLEERRKENKAKVDPHVEEQFLTGRLYGKSYREGNGGGGIRRVSVMGSEGVDMEKV